jgi:hypothetical protein
LSEGKAPRSKRKYGALTISKCAFTLRGVVICGGSRFGTTPVAKERRRKITLLIIMPEAHKRKRIDNMNVVDHLLEHRFETLSLEEKLEVKRLMSCALQSIYVFPVLYVPTAGLRLVVVASGL